MWKYIQQSGELLDASGKLVATGYSGFGLAKNDPSAQHVPNLGPIPVGMYTIELIADASGNAIDYGNKKAPVMRLIPDADTDTFGRSGFLMHGDNQTHTASEGCIIADHQTRVDVWASGDHMLQVVPWRLAQRYQGQQLWL